MHHFLSDEATTVERVGKEANGASRMADSEFDLLNSTFSIPRCPIHGRVVDVRLSCTSISTMGGGRTRMANQVVRWRPLHSLFDIRHSLPSPALCRDRHWWLSCGALPAKNGAPGARPNPLHSIFAIRHSAFTALTRTYCAAGTSPRCGYARRYGRARGWPTSPSDSPPS